jgi:hypothetical protein
MSLAVKTARATSQGGVGRGRTVSAGDPGLFGFLGGVVKTVGSLITGGPIAAARTAVAQVLPRSRPGVPSVQVLPVPGPRGALQRLLPGGETGLMVGAAGMGCPQGHHPNRSDYFLRDGSFVAKGTRCVKNRRRNPLNPRAASRAIARITSAKKATKMLGRITIRAKDAHHHHKKKK